jgi:thiamine kinase-like enzyme
METNAKTQAEQLACWKTPVTAVPLSGGLTNTNFKVHYQGQNYVVRIGEDIPEHGVMRFNEMNASVAAFKTGISPEIIHSIPGALVMRFIEGKTLASEDINQDKTLERILPILKKCHYDVPKHLNAGALSFWVFQVNRNYAGTLKSTSSNYRRQLNELMAINDKLEQAVGRVNMAFCHNDMLAANFIETDEKLWLIDWDYAGFNSPLFDLSNLATNNNLTHTQERWLLDNYFECDLCDKLWHSYSAMKCASLLRESMWSMVSEQYSKLDFDYQQYTQEYMTRFDRSYQEFKDI